MGQKLVDIEDVRQELIKKGQCHGLAELALRKVPEAVVRCERCERFDPLDKGWGICTEHGANAMIFRQSEEFCSRGKRRM